MSEFPPTKTLVGNRCVGSQFSGAQAAVNLTAKQLRRAARIGAYIDHRVRRAEDAKKRFDAYRAEWRVEREVARLVGGSSPLIVGPWLSEVGYEVLYWIPFLRWVQATYHVDPDRLLVVTRGGAASSAVLWHGRPCGARAREGALTRDGDCRHSTIATVHERSG